MKRFARCVNDLQLQYSFKKAHRRCHMKNRTKCVECLCERYSELDKMMQGMNSLADIRRMEFRMMCIREEIQALIVF